MKTFGQKIKETIDSEVIEMGRDLNRDIIEELKEAKHTHSKEAYKALRKERNKQRIAALGVKLIQGGKE